ncbi:hypothetical protein CW731_11785 [Polaribacter sp. ALD11]|uniref:DUF11 domain-containing protein n=1 Tax=Polaribacter sp. ALD11 TaxID=2058137 RepID=UPI000C3177AC|nr:DUF11 domain-containing protein [Polaribacter sp. ALD11]AUC85929.1 hypothetical protein CW731_11785 [Polaribacter sp. ALD11]
MIKKYSLLFFGLVRHFKFFFKELKIVLYICLTFLCFFSGIQSTLAQATFTGNATAADLVGALQSEGVTITNAVITVGGLGQRGVFSNGKVGAGLQVDDGIALTTSSITNAFSTNSEPRNSDFFSGSYVDKDLRQLSTISTNDVVVFEFDFVAKPNFKGVLLEYQFASEEYPDYVGSTFNDLFGFFVSDPNMLDPNVPDGDLNNNGTYDLGEEPALNLAVVPGTTNFVSINNINVGSPGSSGNTSLGDYTKGNFYINNGHAADDGDSATQIPVNQNTGPKPLHIEFNGATTKLATQLDLIIGITYHMKIVIADLGDSGYDSGVFISGIAGLPEIETRDDQGSVTENVGGVAVQNVLINDDYAGTANPPIANVALFQISTTNSGVTLDVNTGAVNVAPGTPVGNYQIEYRVCKPAPDNCSNSFVYVAVLSDNDNDGVPDVTDVDDDNDGVLDTDECPAPVVYNDSFEVPDLDALGPSGLGDVSRPDSDADGEADIFLSQTSIEGWNRTDNINSFDIAYDVYNSSKGLQSIDLYGTPGATGIQKTFSGFKEGVAVDFSVDYSSVAELFEATVSVDYGDGPVLLTTLKPSTTVTAASPGVVGARISTVVWASYTASLLPTASGTIKIIIQSSSFGSGQTGVLIDNVVLSQTTCTDKDGDLIPDSFDTDSDNDGCPDAIEGAGSLALDKLTTLAGGSTGGSSKNLGVNSDANGSPIVDGQGASGYTQNQTTAVIDASINTGCTTDLTITKTVSKPVLKIGQTVVFTLTLKNEGLQAATNVKVRDLLPVGLTYDLGGTVVPANTTYTPGTGIWDLSALTIAKNQTIELKIGATVNTVGEIITNSTEIFTVTETDIDSNPDNSN